MRTAKLWRLLAIVSLFGLLAAACGNDGDESSSDDDDGGGTTDSPVVEDDSAAASEDADPSAGEPTDITTVTEGVLTVCAAVPNGNYAIEEDGEFTGFDIELLRTAATNLGLVLEVSPQPAEGIWTLPASGTCDVAAAAIEITPEREAEVLFSEPYVTAEQTGDADLGFATSEANAALIDAIDAEVARLRDNGDYDAIYADWFG